MINIKKMKIKIKEELLLRINNIKNKKNNSKILSLSLLLMARQV
jgi:hypothetical protein